MRPNSIETCPVLVVLRDGSVSCDACGAVEKRPFRGNQQVFGYNQLGIDEQALRAKGFSCHGAATWQDPDGRPVLFAWGGSDTPDGWTQARVETRDATGYREKRLDFCPSCSTSTVVTLEVP